MSTNAVTSASSAANHDEETIVRYSFADRANHWIGALAYIYLIATGLAFWSPYLFWMAAVVGGGPTARFCHPWVGLLFSATLFWSFKEWRRDMVADDSDRAWSKAIPYYIKNEDEKVPAAGRFNFGQKIYFWGMVYSTILLIISGVALWYTETLPWNFRYLRYAAVLVHASVAMITIGLFLIHVYMSTIMEEGSFGSMVSGKVTHAWAWTFHRNWYYDIIGRSRPKP